MTEPVLVVHDDPFALDTLADLCRPRGWEVIGVRSPAEASALLSTGAFGVAVVDLHARGELALALVRQLRACDAALEYIVIACETGPTAAIASETRDAFAVLHRFEPTQVAMTVERAIERRRGALERQRLSWELSLLNEVASIVASSPAIDVLMQRAAGRIASAFGAEVVVVRLRPAGGGDPRVVAAAGADRQELDRLYAQTQGNWPSEQTIRRGRVVRVDALMEDRFAQTELHRKFGWRSLLSVPIALDKEILGAVEVCSLTSARFANADEQFLQAIGRQFAVAVTNAQLYERVHRAKVEWERTFDAISDPIAVFDARGRTMRVNAALAALRGWPITQTQGRTCAEVGLCGGGCPDCVVGLASREQRSSEREVETGDSRIFAVTTLPITGPSGAVVQFGKEMTEERRRAAQLRDLSQELRSTNAELVSTLDRLRTTQAQLVQSEKLSAIGLLVAGVAHELNNPLTSVIGYAQLVNDELANRPDLADAATTLSVDVSRILTESDRAARIVRNLLTFARSQSSERERQDLADLCARVVQLRAYDFRLKEIEVVTRFAAGLPPVHVDGGQIQQVLLNLLLNAEQAMKKAETRRLEISVGFEPDCGAVLTEIRDTGHGIETSNLRRIFDPFFTTRGVGEGTGLGLSIAYGIVRDHGGQIWAESRPERTAFFIRLPARIDMDLAGRIGTVLVAHGDPVMRDFLSAVFVGWGFPVRSVPDLGEALESLAEDDIGLAIVDRTVVEPDPGRWDAAWTRRARRARRPMLVVIAPSSAERETVRFFRNETPVVLAPPYDLYQIRCALLTAAGVES